MSNIKPTDRPPSTPARSSPFCLTNSTPTRTPSRSMTSLSPKWPVTPRSSNSPQSILKESPQTPKSARSRSCWVFQSYKLGKSYSVEITVKTHLNRIGPLSASKTPSYKPSFGAVVNFAMENRVKEKTGEHIKHLVVTNEDNVKHPCRQDLLYMFLKSTDSFTQVCQGLISDGKVKLLVKYLNSCIKSEGFTMHQSDKFTKEGVEVSEQVPEDFLNDGGSLDELRDFIVLAKKHAIVIGGATGGVAINRIIKQKRINDFYLADVPPKKMNKTELIEHNFKKECQDVDGLEHSLVSKYSGFQLISLDNLSVSQNLCLPVNESAVISLAESMADRFNPALCVLTVTGEDDLFSNDKYSVLEGVHRYKALKLLDAQGKFEKLPGVKDRKVQCFVLTCTGDAAVDNYCNIRTNDQARQYQSDSDLGMNQLIYVFVFLFKHYGCDWKKEQKENTERREGAVDNIYVQVIV